MQLCINRGTRDKKNILNFPAPFKRRPVQDTRPIRDIIHQLAPGEINFYSDVQIEKKLI